MEITRRIKLNNNCYYIVVDVEYKNHESGFAVLRLKDFYNDYWDSGDCSLLIKEIEKNYTLEKAKKYDKNISFMADIIYIYERMPFISGIKEISIDEDDKTVYSECYISKTEIQNYIEKFNIQVNFNVTFKLMDARTWKF